jgi:hypothetical protein
LRGAQNVAKSLIDGAWTKSCFTPPTISTGLTFSIQAGKSCNSKATAS